MRRAALGAAGLTLALAAMAVPASSQHGAEQTPAPAARASIGFDSLRPQHLNLLTGDTVRWTNDSVRAHTVTADDGSFDSGRIVSAETFDRRFTARGATPYHCRLHPFIRGVVDVRTLLLGTPDQAAASNREFPLSGRAALAAGTAVTIEADRGAGFGPVATTTLEPDGTFVAHVVPGTTATYRAVAGNEASPTVRLLVLDRRISFRAQRGRHRFLIRTAVTPAASNARVVLQLFLREHFGWWPVQRGRLDKTSSAHFSLRLRRRVAARVLLTLPDGATPLAISRTVRLGPRH